MIKLSDKETLVHEARGMNEGQKATLENVVKFWNFDR